MPPSRRRDAAPAVHFKPSLSSLNLQICLFYNMLFSIIFAVIVGSCSVNKLLYYNKRVSISVLCIWAAIEPARLYYGFSGNLRERVPELSTYLLIRYIDVVLSLYRSHSHSRCPPYFIDWFLIFSCFVLVDRPLTQFVSSSTIDPVFGVCATGTISRGSHPRYVPSYSLALTQLQPKLPSFSLIST